MTLYRPHRGMLADAMMEVVEVADLSELVDHMRASTKIGREEDMPTLDNIKVEKYGTGIDTRIGWDTYIVLVGGSVWGFTNGPMET